MGKPIAGINDYPYGICGYVVDGVYLRDGTKMKSLRIYKQRSDIMFDLIDPKTNSIYMKVLLTGKDVNGEILDYSKSNDTILNEIPRNTFFLRGYNDKRTREGFVVRFLLNKVILSTGMPIFDMYTPTCNPVLPTIDNIIVQPIRDGDTEVSGTLTSSSGSIDNTDMIITLTLPDGSTIEGTVNSDGTFIIQVPDTIKALGSVIITVTSPNYEEATGTFPILSGGDDSDYVTAVNVSSSDFALQSDGSYTATVNQSLHQRGSNLVLQLQHESSAVMFSTVNVDANGNISINQSQASNLVVVIIGSTIDTIPFKTNLTWSNNGDGTFSSSILATQHLKENISFTVYDGTSVCTVQVQIDDDENLVLTSLESFNGSIVITGKV